MDLFQMILVFMFAVILCFIFTNFRWIVHHLREIASHRNPGGYAKLIQSFLVIMLCLIFIILVIYYLLNPGVVSSVDIILTVVVGWLGAIIGSFFSERTMEYLSPKNLGPEEKNSALALKVKYEELLNKIHMLREIIEKQQLHIESLIQKLKKK